jgi:MscS family membrane protein
MWLVRLMCALVSLAILWTWTGTEAASPGSQLVLANIGGSMREIQFLDNPLWRYLIFLGVIILALILMKVIDNLLDRKIRQWAARKANQVYSVMVDVIRKPLRLVIVIVAIWVALSPFELPVHYQKLVNNLLMILTAILATIVLLKIVDLLVAIIKPRVQATESRLDDQLLPILGKALKIFILVIAALVMMQNMGYNVTSVLAGLGIGGLAVALAAQDTLSNIFGSVAIFADRPFVVGERVIFDKYDGIVEGIGLRSTKIRTLEGTLVSVPNSLVARNAVDNIGRRPTIRNLYTITVTYDTSYRKLQAALEILRELFKNHPSTDDYWVYFKEFGSHSLNILVIHWCKYTKYQEFLEATEELNLEIKRRFEQKGIEFAFPTQTLYLRPEAEGFPPQPAPRS